MTNDPGHDARTRALRFTENELRHRVDALLEQCGREALTPGQYHSRPIGPFLYIGEILMLLGVGPGPSYSALEPLIETAEGDLTQSEFEARDRAAYDADPEGWIHDHTVNGIRPHIPRRPGDDEKAKFAAEFPGYCPDGTCGVCGACQLRAEGF